LSRRRERHDTEDAGTDALGDGLDRAALAGAVAPLEDDADLGSGGLDPLLHRNEFSVQHAEFGLVLLPRHLGAGLGPRLGAIMLVGLRGHLVHLLDRRPCGPVGPALVQLSAFAFACWNSASLITPWSRRAASRAISSAVPAVP